MAEECDENDYHLDLDSYKPVQPIKYDHAVTLFPVAAPHTGMDLHLLQVRRQRIAKAKEMYGKTKKYK